MWLLMETLPVEHRPLLIVGGNPALDLANTVDAPGLRTEFDHLQHPATALAWAERAGLIDDRQRSELARYADRLPDLAVSELRRLHRLRRAVEEVFGAIADRTDIPETGWAALRRAAGEAVAAAVPDRRGDHVHPTWDLATLEALSRPLAYAGWDLLTSGPLGRVKRCPACPWIYLDQSKNGSRRWCAMDDCGKAVKMRRYVAKRAAARATAHQS
jgi:predicted RNA-binding Zn ribbon-like protein